MSLSAEAHDLDTLLNELAALRAENTVLRERVAAAWAKVTSAELGEVDGARAALAESRQALAAEQQRHQESRVLLKILRDRLAFESFLRETREELCRAEVSVRSGQQSVARRLIHNVKGNSALFGLYDVEREAHEVEEEELIVPAAIRRIRQRVGEFLDHHHDVLGISWEDDLHTRRVDVSGSELEALQAAADEGDWTGVHAWLKSIQWLTAGQVLGPLGDLVARVADYTGKQVELRVVGADLRVPPDTVEPVLRAIHHLIENAVVHGIESPSARGGKAPIGAVRLELVEEDGRFIVQVEDDGAGVDVARLAAMANERGFEPPRRADWTLIDLMSVDGVTTTPDVGRGEGVAAVRGALAAAGGAIEVSSVRGQGTLFTLWLGDGGPNETFARHGSGRRLQ